MAGTNAQFTSYINSDLPDWEVLGKTKTVDDGESSSIASDWSIIGDEHFAEDKSRDQSPSPSSVDEEPIEVEPCEPFYPESPNVPLEVVDQPISTDHQSNPISSVQPTRIVGHSSSSVRHQRQVNRQSHKKDVSRATQIRNNKACNAARLANKKAVKQQFRGAMLSHASQRSQNKSCHQ